jgi:hypothetical protein
MFKPDTAAIHRAWTIADELEHHNVVPDILLQSGTEAIVNN